MPTFMLPKGAPGPGFGVTASASGASHRRAYPSSRHRTEALPAWPYYYNWARGYGALHGRPPISSLVAPNNSWRFTARGRPLGLIHGRKRFPVKPGASVVAAWHDTQT